MFRITALKILGRVGTLNFLFIFSGKNIILCTLKGISPFKMHKIIDIFFRKSKKILGLTSKFM